MFGQVNQKLITTFTNKYLKPGEKIQGMVQGSVNTLINWTHIHYLILTNIRIVFWQRNVLEDNIMAYTYDSIDEYRTNMGFMSASIFVYCNGQRIEFNNMRKGTLEKTIEFIDYMREHGVKSRDESVLTNTESPIVILRRRLALGEIDDNEFQYKLKLLTESENLENSNGSSVNICGICNQSNPAESNYCMSCGSTT